MKYRIDTPRIAFEQIEGETILIDFDSGTYYSAGTVGSDILQWIAKGAAVEEIIVGARARYLGDGLEIETQVRAFIDALLRESILIETTGAGFAPPPVPTEKTAFDPPVLQKYTDMKDLLLLDPIHEVDPEGWPIQKPDA